MPTLLIEDRMLRELDDAPSTLGREGWTTAAAGAGPKLLEQALALLPDVIVLSDGGGDPWPLIDQIRREPDLRSRPMILVAAGDLDPRSREALAGAGVRVIRRAEAARALAPAIAALLNEPTRVSLRTRVVFEVRGKSDQTEVLYGRMYDISTGGFLMESEREFASGDSLYCFFAVGPTSPVIFATGRIVRRRALPDGLFEYGLEFSEIRLDDRRRIADLVLQSRGVAV